MAVAGDDHQAPRGFGRRESSRLGESRFGDPDALDGPDLSHSENESRFLRLGRAVTGRVLIVAYTVRRRDDAESITARRASRQERAAYTAASGD